MSSEAQLQPGGSVNVRLEATALVGPSPMSAPSLTDPPSCLTGGGVRSMLPSQI